MINVKLENIFNIFRSNKSINENMSQEEILNELETFVASNDVNYARHGDIAKDYIGQQPTLLSNMARYVIDKVPYYFLVSNMFS